MSERSSKEAVLTVVRYNINAATIVLTLGFLIAYVLSLDEWAIFILLGLIMVFILQNLIFAYREMLS